MYIYVIFSITAGVTDFDDLGSKQRQSCSRICKKICRSIHMHIALELQQKPCFWSTFSLKRR